ncbi:MAG: hypothetical protein EBU46_00140 [Nitrosomonadaceae bacterium]|nr:hypothetical protein [Nitrosomonadaceae bacterium]
MQLKNTKDCTILVTHLYGYPYSNWRRARKYKEGVNWVRDFTNDNGLLVKVVTTPKHEFSGIGLVNNLVVNCDTVATLKRKAKTIKHCGDYGQLFYHPATKQVWWCCGDADCDPDGPTDTVDMIKAKLNVADGLTIHVEAEVTPDIQRGWLSLGRFGKVVEL